MMRRVDSHNRKRVHTPLPFEKPRERFAHIPVPYECARHVVSPYEVGTRGVERPWPSRRPRFLETAVFISRE